jgi:cardiolipin synthase
VIYIILIIVGVVVIGFLTLSGMLSAVKGTPVARGDAPGQEHVPGPKEPGFRRAMELVSRTMLQPGHAVEIFTNGDQTYPRLWADLASATRVITMQMYYCEKGRMADTLRDTLTERARAGVKVYFLYDAFGTSFKKEYIQSLQAAGIRTSPFRPFSLLTAYKVQNRAHIRVTTIDGRIGYTGGFGISDKWYGNGLVKGQWRDTNVRFTGPAVHQLQAAFVACWAEATGDLMVGGLLFPDGAEPTAPGSEGECLAGVLHGSPSIGSTEAERFFALSIASARERLYITNSYFVPDREFRALISAAARRGVDTRVLTAGDASDVKSTVYASRARYEDLLENGVRIYEYRDTMMHAKTIVVDGEWAACGSMNADNRSLSFNEETVLLMLDRTLAADFERHFGEDLTHSDEILLDTFRKRGLWERTKEHANHLVWRVL